MLATACAFQPRASDLNIQPTLINGEEVPLDKYPAVVRITSNGAGCTASVIADRALVTAAHCAEDGAKVAFTSKGVTYNGVASRSPLYASKDHDINAILIDKKIPVLPISIAPLNSVKVGQQIRLIGYGCVTPGGGGGNDGILRSGLSTVTGFSGFDFISKMLPLGAALCYGDSGGPVFDMAGKQSAVNSKGNIRDTNYTTRLDVQESRDFLQQWAVKNGVGVCGITQDCSGSPPPADPKSFTFENSIIKITGKIK